ncbi:two-component system sensor histidine kinase NtrB [Pyrinomonas methylaliphatogenes]|uniref:histidine kinase n=1 Tax=Pyrinomonas methylaliphatogenes TaxID=454194 RepID=A0A0B6WY12_9BACT|nr:ATP-binding protein [Pyrinomonas methylaliphatogenes]CDM65592.1 PAS domain S-box [Pyrinomonas methylaliphatogenes]
MRGSNYAPLWRLIIGRLGLASLLLILGLFIPQGWTGGNGSWLFGTLPVIIAVSLLSLIYAALLRFSALALRAQAAWQFALDAFLITWLVWATNGMSSPYTALYIVAISFAGAYLGARGALLMSVGCASLYTASMLALIYDLIPSNGATENARPIVNSIQIVGFNDIAILVVGLLAARFAERHSRSEEATHALAHLRALHQRIVESIRSGVVTTDLEGRIYTFNPAAEEITGYRANEVRGRDASFLFGDLREKIDLAVRAAKEGAHIQRYEADTETAEGFRLRLGYSISPLSDEAGETTGLVITFQDLTEVRALEENARRQDRLAAVGRVAAGIAHEIRNPLASMRGAIQVLRSTWNGDPAEAELMEIILRESDRLDRIITDFLAYARPRPVTLIETDLREPLRETFALLRHNPETRPDHSLEIIAPDQPVIALVDAEQLRQVFWNLARNALRAMPDGGRLSAELTPLEDGRVRITFTDTGCGMTPEQVEQLFEPFTSWAPGGTGLGLSIVYQIIRDHGGTINVYSREGRGTTVRIELPWRRGPEKSESA